jgi:hypothetical protein
MFSGMSLLAIILAPQLAMLNRILGTEPLTIRQWFICVVVGFAPVVVTEIRKFVLNRREAAEKASPSSPAPTAAS